MFFDRTDAGHQLANKLLLSGHQANLVLGLARGGVVVSNAIATSLGIPHDVLVVKKIGSPGNPELAIGAVAPDGISYIDEALARAVGADERYITTQTSKLNALITQKTSVYRKGKNLLTIRGKTIIIADDGSATGATMYAAVRWVRRNGAQTIIIALPVASPEVVTGLRALTGDVYVLETPTDFGAVGEFYKHFPQLTDQDVIKLLS